MCVFVQHCVVTLEDAGDDAAADERFTIQILDLRYGVVIYISGTDECLQ